ncbi:YeaH/YhbH family protein [Aureibacter tunicatorum]|uniref:UPF0229 protein HNQ88_001908 n=1 Tax=Aureibacter tunicatorum TaxID=866807 RepID=A0AAE4BRP2_9BACT|nr:YeaH/YhbH family protein [Aureibacter tunicatorum]MDR6238871.1 hypothetical protein [Aureibacter tunicatorum]BDD05202.1 UPF0229 protein [Aureibacter tunicatorum]
MSIILDRRSNASGKSSNNRQKFLRRIDKQIKDNLPRVINSESITEQSSEGTVKVPVKGLKEPSFSHDQGTGDKRWVRPGNDRFREGDRIPKPPPQGGGGQGAGKGAGDGGPTEDEFVVHISRDEFLKYFFDELELPNMLQKHMEKVEDTRQQRAGFVRYGVPSRINIKRSYHEALARQMAIKGALDKKIKALQKKIDDGLFDGNQLAEALEEVEKLKKHRDNVPFMDDVDIRYQNFEEVKVPISSAVMFCIMDVSASMTEHEKGISKRFFTLLYLFLTKQYKQVDVVFIRHHTEALEVDENDFFNSRESGGTKVLPSLELMESIIDERYDASAWNIYACQASDGDVWSLADARDCRAKLSSGLLDKLQYMAYLEISREGMESDLWKAYNEISDDQLFSMRKIQRVNQIWEVFRGLFRKRNLSLD